MARVARGGALNFAGTVVTQVSVFGVTLLLSLRLGRSAVGVYAQVYAFLPLLSLLSLAGFRAAMTRFVAIYRAAGDDGALCGTVRLGLGVTLAAGTALAIPLFLAARWLAHGLFDEPAMETPLRLVALTLPFAVFAEAALSATQGFKTMRYFAGIGLIAEPALRGGLSLALVLLGAGVDGAVAALLVSNVIAAVAAYAALRRMLRPHHARPRYPVREVFSFSMISWVASLASTGLIYADILLLGVFLSSSEVGIYQVATRVVLLANATMLPINQSVSPHLADAFGRRDLTRLAEIYRVATGWIVRTSLPAFVVLAMFPAETLRIFGSGFGRGAAVTVILAAGKLIDSATGPCGLVLNMAGRVAVNMVDNVGALALNIAANLWLIPRHGIVGAAAAWALSLAVLNVARVFQVRRAFGMQPFDRALALGAAAAATSILAAVAVRSLDPPLPLVAGSLVVAATYAVTYAFLGVPEEDRLAFRAITRQALTKGAS